jgi:hypothetical protein
MIILKKWMRVAKIHLKDTIITRNSEQLQVEAQKRMDYAIIKSNIAGDLTRSDEYHNEIYY